MSIQRELELMAHDVGNDRTALRKRLQFARSILTDESTECFGHGVYDFERKRLVSDDGRIALQWLLRPDPLLPDSYGNQQTSTGCVMIIRVE